MKYSTHSRVPVKVLDRKGKRVRAHSGPCSVILGDIEGRETRRRGSVLFEEWDTRPPGGEEMKNWRMRSGGAGGGICSRAWQNDEVISRSWFSRFFGCEDLCLLPHPIFTFDDVQSIVVLGFGLMNISARLRLRMRM